MRSCSRYYSCYLNRFIQPDSIVPDLSNPQTLNRYSYVNNRPLNFTDPTGNFSEDEIEKAFHLKTWDEILALFQKGGLLEGRWGWLETLRQAEAGDKIDIQWDNANLPEGHPSLGDSFTGLFDIGKDGEILIGNKGLGIYFDQILAGAYGKHYDLTHYDKNSLAYKLLCSPVPCSGWNFSTDAMHAPYLHTKLKTFSDPIALGIALWHVNDALVVNVGTASVPALVTVSTVGVCVGNPAACGPMVTAAAPAFMLGLTGFLLSLQATYEIVKEEFTETTP